MAKDFFAGGFGGSCLVVVGHPFDTIKVRMQTAESGMYSGVLDCVKKTTAEGGPAVLYRGVWPVMAGVAPMYALCFLGYGYGKDIFCDADAYTAEDQKLFQIACAGAFSAVFTTPILAPGERIKCLQQTDKTGKFSGSFVNTVKHIWAEGGVASVTKGFTATIARDGVASMFYFSVYELLKRKFADMEGVERGTAPSAVATLTAGGLAGMANWAGCLPIDSLKSRYQIAPAGQYSGTVLGAKSVLKEVMASGAPLKQLYKGATPVFLRAFPANAACFFGMETAYKFLTDSGIFEEQ
jgi:solute carrier family 25 carnitine/acylcarnitine transporter 20/29